MGGAGAVRRLRSSFGQGFYCPPVALTEELRCLIRDSSSVGAFQAVPGGMATVTDGRQSCVRER